MIPVIYPNYYPHQTTYNKRDNVATIVTTKVGTFSSSWKGSGTLYFDPGDGGPIEPLVLTIGGVAWNHVYSAAGSKIIGITGDLSGVTFIQVSNQSIINSIHDLVSNLTVNLQYLYINDNLIYDDVSALSELTGVIAFNIYNNAFHGDISALVGLINVDYLRIFGNLLSFTYTQFPAWSGVVYDMSSCVSTSQEVGDLIRAAANGGMNNCIYKLDGTNPAPPDTQEVIDGISTLAGNGVTLYVST
jgi:hypothetical protein